jgi:hypothetical protein
MRKFLGFRENWLDEGSVTIRGKRFNGERILYILWIEVWRGGFNHSTMWTD